MSDTQTAFAAHVHEVVDLDAHGATLEAIEEHLDAMPLDQEEESALWLLAYSLRNGAHAHRAGSADALLAHARN